MTCGAGWLVICIQIAQLSENKMHCFHCFQPPKSTIKYVLSFVQALATFATNPIYRYSVRWFARNSHIRGCLNWRLVHRHSKFQFGAVSVSVRARVLQMGCRSPEKRKQTLSHLSFSHVKIVNFRPKYDTLCKVYGCRLLFVRCQIRLYREKFSRLR